MNKQTPLCPYCHKVPCTCPAQPRKRPDYHRLYDTARWKWLRSIVLLKQPLCLDCLANNQTTAATEVHHSTPHKGNLHIFWDEKTLIPLCHSCHSKRTYSERTDSENFRN